MNDNHNPYIIGPPIDKPDMLFGRDSLFEEIRDFLEKNTKSILLHGQRRIGKSSVLNILPSVIAREDFLFVYYDLQRDTHSENNIILHNILKSILGKIRSDQDINDININIDYILEEDSNINDVQRTIYDIGYKFHMRRSKLILLLDEFDVTQTDNDIDKAVNFLEYLNNLIIDVREIHLIVVIGRYISHMPKLEQIFRRAPSLGIGFLNPESAQKLITQPAINRLQYRNEAIEKILNFSSAHPLYTQVLCYELFKFARNKNNNRKLNNFTIVANDVNEQLISEALQSSEAASGSFWDGLNPHEKIVVSTLAQAQEDNTIGNPKQMIPEHGLVLTNALENAIDELIAKGFLESNPIKIKVELVRLWLLKHHKLRDEIADLRTLEKTETAEFQTMLNLARSLWAQEDKKTKALNQYELALDLNPNHFNLIVELAGKYCELKNFKQALPLYERAYKLNKLIYKQRFLEALDNYGDCLSKQEDKEKAKEQYENILQLDPENSSAKEKIRELTHSNNENNEIDSASPQISRSSRSSHRLTHSDNENNEIDSNLENSDSSGNNFGGWLQRTTQPGLWKILGVGGIIAVFIAVAIIFINNKQKDCAADQQKNSQGLCVTNSNANSESLSSGDRSLFSQIKTNKRGDIDKFKDSKQEGITSFQQTNYKDAAAYFQQAVKYNSNDPEVLIYQNNSLARKKGEPFVLAVVVPATHKSNYVLAWEILRGIAQAQDEFNKKGGLNDRLLEIIIADDGDSPSQAEKVAKQIVDKKLILGVIGHNASGITTKALPIYEQAKIPIISSTSTSINLNSSVFFRTLPSDRETGKKLARYAINKGLKKVLVLCNPGEPYSSSIKEEFRINLVNLGGEVIDDGCINIANKNVDSEILNSLRNQKEIQAIALLPDTQHLYEAIEIAKRYKTIISGITLLGGDSVYVDDTFSQGGGDIEGLVLAVPWFRETEKSRPFAKKAKDQWGGDVSWRTATSYDAVKAFLDSIDKSINSSQTPSRDTVLDNLKKVEIQETSFGKTLKFNGKRESEREVILLKVKNGQFRTEKEQTRE